ncbi:hypothetical protein [Roseomonas fluvialis]|uniref:Two pore domain potassium channel family protein n=1 Tax=Roseomonas fluvialis TaxID=1750527 RepID=A0ABM7Y677_9PROT|nr:hypothetical protein [Roseomonas fluvialis]BDG73494.1 hypothetical protein Rmf_34230 [Roseomonas fluvialis]
MEPDRVTNPSDAGWLAASTLLGHVISWACIGLGLTFIIVTLISMFSTGLLNRRRRDGVADLVRRVILAAFAARHRGQPFEHIQRGMGWLFPVFIVCLVGTWFAFMQAGFTLILWASGAEPTWLNAFLSSGSALSTLGFLTPTNVLGRLLAILEGAFGLGIIVFIFTFLPGYQAAIRDREQEVAWLYARTGPTGDGASLLEWFWRAHRSDALDDAWENWEGFFRGLVESHTINPMLSLVPTVHAGQSWVVASVRILDAAALAASTVRVPSPETASLCVALGAGALAEIDAALSPLAAVRQDSHGAGPPGLERTDLAAHAALYDRLAAAGIPVVEDREAARKAYCELRQSYMPHLLRIARVALVPEEMVRGQGAPLLHEAKPA